jgi:hypothetical protein
LEKVCSTIRFAYLSNSSSQVGSVEKSTTLRQ